MRPLIAGNWKLHGEIKFATELVTKLKELVKDVKDVDILVCPPFTALRDVEGLVRDSNIMLGSQNVFYEEEGAFTGEISPKMLKELHCKFAIVGHSERREYFMESDVSVNKKVKVCLLHGITPIMCVGETEQEHGEGDTKKVIDRQIEDGLDGVEQDQIAKVVIAYEPIWAISGGDPTHKAATSDDAQEMHAYIRKLLVERYGEEGRKVRILYGGSMKPDNVKGLMAQPDIDGGLVGGASLKAESFAGIIKGSL